MFIVGMISSSVQVRQIKEQIKQENLEIEIIWINSKSIENIKNVKFEILIIQNLFEKIKEQKEILKRILKNTKYLLLNTDITIEEDIFKDINAKIITYGLKQKSTITTSSIEEKQTMVSIQRSFENLRGQVIERQEIPIKLNRKDSNYVYNSLIKIAIINIYGTKKP